MIACHNHHVYSQSYCPFLFLSLSLLILLEKQHITSIILVFSEFFCLCSIEKETYSRDRGIICNGLWKNNIRDRTATTLNKNLAIYSKSLSLQITKMSFNSSFTLSNVQNKNNVYEFSIPFKAIDRKQHIGKPWNAQHGFYYYRNLTYQKMELFKVYSCIRTIIICDASIET